MTDKSKWTEDEQVRLAAFIAEGVPWVAIAAEMGRPHTALQSQATNLGLKFAREQGGRKEPTKALPSTSYKRLFGD